MLRTVLAVGLVLMTMAGASAAEVRVLSAKGASLFLDELASQFERATGNKVSISYGEAGIIRKRLLAGEACDLTIVPAGWDTIRGKIVGDPVPIAHADLGMGVLANVPKPNISTNDAARQILLAAKAIVYTDPKSGGASGVLFLRMIEKLGIADEVNKKSKLVTGVLSAKFLLTGEADLVAQSSSEILAVPGVQFIPMPPDFRSSIVFAGAVAANARNAAAAKAFLQFLTAPSAVPVIRAKGYEPD
jgi:molybdate transport system substrate-binding protein